ncbi:MAG: division/cell wall cluster transcriptional repressor MraZ [bacterium]
MKSFFFGRHYHSVDSKGRVAIPFSFRRKLGPEPGEMLILHARPDGAIRVHPAADWTEFWEAALPGITRYQDDSDDARRLLGEVEEVALDRQGRVLIPRPMLDEAGISDQVVFSGAGEFFEIWNPERYREDQRRNAEKRRHAIAEAERRVKERTAQRGQERGPAPRTDADVP